MLIVCIHHSYTISPFLKYVCVVFCFAFFFHFVLLLSHVWAELFPFKILVVFTYFHFKTQIYWLKNFKHWLSRSIRSHSHYKNAQNNYYLTVVCAVILISLLTHCCYDLFARSEKKSHQTTGHDVYINYIALTRKG